MAAKDKDEKSEPAKPKGEIYVATETGEVDVDGRSYPIKKGVTRVREGHELLAAAPALFKVIDVHYEIEDATREPGRKRGE
jgi:hypothetical protein